jgi:hypothetical protein
MADAKTGKTGHSGHAETEQTAGRSEDRRSLLEQEGLLELLDAHARAVAVAVGEVLIERLARLESRPTEDRHHERPREGREEIEREHERGEEAWLAKYPPGDREHFKKTDRELRRLEETLEGPERLLDRDQDNNRPPVKHEGTWRLPEYKPVPPDRREKLDGGI